MRKIISLFILMLFISACAEIEPKPFKPSDGHISVEDTPAIEEAEIPRLVEQAPVLPEPDEPEQLERYTVVVNEVPVKELLFALARDAKLNVDIDPAISGVVTINAVEQTLPQILKRISRQVDMRYEFDSDNLVISTNEPFFKTYTIDYINIARTTTSSNTVATSLATTSGTTTGGGGGGAFSGNNATMDVTSSAEHQLWINITNNILAILGETDSVIPIPEAGVLTVKATERQHELIQEFLDKTMANVRREVLIQATIVEVRLTEDYQAGIDWGLVNNQLIKAGIDIASTTLPVTVPLGTVSSFVLQTEENATVQRETSLSTTVRLLNEFGDVNIMSSPQLMALNNQTAILKRVENKVFFTFDSNVVTPATGPATTSVDTTINSLPVGIVMSITPHIAKNGEVTLHIRPTISRQTGTNRDIPLPNGVTLPAGASNQIPETVTQEMESLIRLNSGETAVLGGLMEDTTTGDLNKIPGAGDAGLLGNLFKTTTKNYQKTEVVIFLRPIIINRPSLEADFEDYKQFLNPTRYQQQQTSGSDN